jgi:hypothetical protein
MKTRLFSLLSLATGLLIQPLVAQETAAGTGAEEAAAPADIGWPREYATDTHSVIVYQPQIDEWADYKTISMRIAVGIAEKGKEDEEDAVQYGALFAEVSTDVNREEGQVLLTDRKVTKMVFNGVDEAGQKKLGEILKAALPDQQELVVSLERVVAAVETSQQQQREIEASDEVPPIFVSNEPALLMMFMGEPSFEPVPETGLKFATNTNWDVFTTGGDAPSYFLRVEENWFTTKDPKNGKWDPAGKLPGGFAKLPKDDNWAEVSANLPGKPAASAMKVFYVDRPAELIVIDGKPAFGNLVGDKLVYVSNTEADLFFHFGDKAHYFLSAGRWFTAPTLEDDWTIAADLPPEFAQIPENHEKSYVLACVAGTPAATEAVVIANIPETATIDRKDAILEVTYEGDPLFAAVPGTQGVEFAVNTEFDVFKVSGKYYCCFQAIWFVSASPTGPWAVCDSVPDPIYTVPAEHPKHNVTYVAVKSSTPTTVETSYTSGYNGNYVVKGLVMFGLGYWIAKDKYNYSYPSHYHYRYHCRPPYYGYGCRARPAHYGRGYHRAGGRYYGPYGGAGRSAVYNPRTGGWARSSYAYGPRGSASARAGYNPYTNTFGAQARATTPYGSWSKGVTSRNGNWARGGTATTRRGTAGGVKGSGGGGIVHGNKRFGGQGTVAKTPGGDVYVGRNGEINKLDKSGSWQTRQDNSWQNSSKSSLNRTTGTGTGAGRIDTSQRPGTATRPSTGTPTRPSTGTPTRPSTKPTPSKSSSLDRQAYSRHRGSQTTQRSKSSSRSSSRSAPSRSAPSRGGRRN